MRSGLARMCVALVLLTGVCHGAEQWPDGVVDKGYVVFSTSILQSVGGDHVPTRSELIRDIRCTMARDEFETFQVGVHAAAADLRNIRVAVRTDLGVTVYCRTAGSRSGLAAGDRLDALGKDRSARFWVTLQAPADLPERPDGEHVGSIRITVQDRPATDIPLVVSVRPFVLPRARISFGMWSGRNVARHIFDAVEAAGSDYEHPAPDGFRIPRFITACYADMRDHGHTSASLPGICHWYRPDGTVELEGTPVAQHAELLLESGLVTPDIAVHMSCWRPPYGFNRDAYAKFAAELRTACRQRNWPEIVIYADDEPGYPRDRGNVEKFAGRHLPYRTRTTAAMSMEAAYGFGYMHDIWIVHADGITAELVAEAERLGAEPGSYSCQMLGFQVIPNRHYAGLFTWAHRLRANWIYDYARYANALAEPGDAVSSVGWEARREGIGDYRYLQTLEDSIAADPDRAAAREARAWLGVLRTEVKTDPHVSAAGKPLAVAAYDRIRDKAAAFIERLGVAAPAEIRRRPPGRLKDWGATFRGKSVAECRAGLRDSDVGVRRAAVTALFEMGERGAAAAPALAGALDDPELRMAALRALERMGAAAAEAAPAIAALYAHQDAFVRVGVMFALATKGGAGADTLVKALDDPDGAVAVSAGSALARIPDVARDVFSRTDSWQRLSAMIASEDWQRRNAATFIITRVGPAAAPTAPALIRYYDGKRGQAPYVAAALAALGPAASAAVPVIEKHLRPDSKYLADAYYTLYCIRGDEADLGRMLRLLERDDLNRPTQRSYVITFLNCLGVQAGSVTGTARELIESGRLTEAEVRGLRSFLGKVADNIGPSPFYAGN